MKGLEFIQVSLYYSLSPQIGDAEFVVEIGLQNDSAAGDLCNATVVVAGAIVVGERRPLSIKVQATSGRAVSSEAVSLGLIVTELVINALKHGFPPGAVGEVLVSYDAQASGWRLSVSDNGSGPKEALGEPAHIGLGTSIVEALAHQLKATVEKSSGPEGTWVTITAAEHP